MIAGAFKKSIKFLARVIYRSKDDPFVQEARVGGARRIVLWKSGLFALFFFGFTAFFAYVMTTEAPTWSLADPTVTIPKDRWVALESVPGTCSTTAPVDLSCPAHVDNPVLWNSASS